ncbi:MAG: hypothetical protein ABWK15_04990 [Dissulfuribacterales bacterium]
MDGVQVLESLKTENVIERLHGLEPKAILTHPVWGIPFFWSILCVLVCLGFLFFHMYRTASVLVSVIIMWFGVYYTLPDTSQPMTLSDLAGFVGVCVVVIALNAYVFFVKGD